MVECECIGGVFVPSDLEVLIDTWWNVNHVIIRLQDFDYLRFNRYMVECEYSYRMQGALRAIGFNRYMVECEFSLLFALLYSAGAF